MTGTPEQRRRLIHDSRRNTDGSVLGPLHGACELERLQLELGNRAQCDGDRDLERSGRRQSGADRQRRMNCPFDADGRTPEIRKLRLDRRRVPSPVRNVTRALERVRGEERPLRSGAVDADAEVERDR